MFGFFGKNGEKEEIRFEDVIGSLEGLKEGIGIDLSYRAGRNRENGLDLSPEQVKTRLRNRLSPEREFSYGERYDGVSSLMGAAATDDRVPEGLYTEAVRTVTEHDDTVHHSIEIRQGFLYGSGKDRTKGRVLREAEISYDLPLDEQD